jgi:hypothetical protein
MGLLKCPQSLVGAYMMAIAQQATGINAVMFYAPKFLALGGVPPGRPAPIHFLLIYL